jgi:hypothetical protein
MIKLKNILFEIEERKKFKSDYFKFEKKFCDFLEKIIYFFDARRYYDLTSVKNNVYNHSDGLLIHRLEDISSKIPKISKEKYNDVFYKNMFDVLIQYFLTIEPDNIGDALSREHIGNEKIYLSEKENIELEFLKQVLIKFFDDSFGVTSAINGPVKTCDIYDDIFKASYYKLITNLDKVWHQHGMQQDNCKKFLKDKNKQFPIYTNYPKKSFDNRGVLCVETGNLLQNQEVFTINLKDDTNSGYYTSITGIILDAEIRKLCDVNNQATERDHLIFNNNRIDIRNWVFLHDTRSSFLDNNFEDVVDKKVYPIDVLILGRLIMLFNLMEPKLKMYFCKPD